MRILTGTLALAAAIVFAAGCDKHEDHKHGGGGHGDHGGTVSVPLHYKDAVHKCEELSGKIGGLISSGNLKDVHAAAADIKKIAEKLPELAQTDLKPEMLKDVNIKAKELAGMFNEIDEAADAGKKEETARLHERMKTLIADLKKHAEHGEGGHEKH